MKELFPDIYIENIKFPDSDITPINLYLIKGDKRSLLIDTGIHAKRCKDTIASMLASLNISNSELDVFITHNHTDHSGLAEELSELGARIFMNPAEADYKHDLMHCYLADRRNQEKVLRTIGITPEHTPELYHAFLYNAYKNYGESFDYPDFKFNAVEPGETLKYGKYKFRVISLRGHTYGQLGLFEKESKLLFCADQIMTTITPIVGSMYPDISLLECYMNSMEILKHTYSECTLLPCHYDIITDAAKEVDRIVISYLNKCDIMKRILDSSDKPMTVKQIGMIAYGRKEENINEELVMFTMIMAKTFSCLEYLYEEGFINRTSKNGILYWSD